jgi:multicomponent Na+:H+ antiporter subunit D
MNSMSSETFISIALVSPFVAVFLILNLPRKYAEGISILAAFFSFASALALLNKTNINSLDVISLIPEISISFRVDELGLTFSLLASGLWILASFFNYGYVRANEMKHCIRYFACFAASIGAAIGIAMASNLLTFLIFYELLTLATYPLVLHKESKAAFAAARLYLLFALTGGLLITVAIVWLWSTIGSLDFVPGGFVQDLSQVQIAAIFFLLLIGCGVKAAIMPMHAWLPSAMVAPSPVSALLHAVAVVKAGVFGCMRMIGFVFKPELLTGTSLQYILIFICASTILVGSLMALKQENLKRRLAYSTIVHLSYIVLGAALLSKTGFTGSILYMVNHGLAKITLFFCAGAIYATTRYTEVQQLRGVGRRMPWTMGAFTIASLGLIGVPGFCGFIGKLMLAKGALESEHIISMSIMLGASVLTAAYLLPIIKLAFFEAPLETQDNKPQEARLSMLIPLCITSMLVVFFGIFPALVNTQYELALTAAELIFEEIAR